MAYLRELRDAQRERELLLGVWDGEMRAEFDEMSPDERRLVRAVQGRQYRKLSDDTVRAIRRGGGAGPSLGDLALRFDVPLVQVANIVKRRTHKDVPDEAPPEPDVAGEADSDDPVVEPEPVAAAADDGPTVRVFRELANAAMRAGESELFVAWSAFRDHRAAYVTEREALHLLGFRVAARTGRPLRRRTLRELLRAGAACGWWRVCTDGSLQLTSIGMVIERLGVAHVSRHVDVPLASLRTPFAIDAALYGVGNHDTAAEVARHGRLPRSLTREQKAQNCGRSRRTQLQYDLAGASRFVESNYAPVDRGVPLRASGGEFVGHGGTRVRRNADTRLVDLQPGGLRPAKRANAAARALRGAGDASPTTQRRQGEGPEDRRETPQPGTSVTRTRFEGATEAEARASLDAAIAARRPVSAVAILLWRDERGDQRSRVTLGAA